MGKCYIESRLESLALEQLANPALELPNHVMECQFCNAIMDDFKSFYAQANEQLIDLDSTELADRVQEKLQHDDGFLYRFDSLHLLPETPTGPLHSHIFAADTATTSKSRVIKNLGVFASSDERLMVRLLKDMDNSYSLFLVSESPELSQYALVTLLGYEREYVSDSNGYINLGEVEMPLISDIGIKVRSANETITLKLNAAEVASITKTSKLLYLYSDDRRYKVEVSPMGKKFQLTVLALEKEDHPTHGFTRVMLVKETACQGVKIPENGVVQFHDVEDLTDLQIKIFS